MKIQITNLNAFDGEVNKFITSRLKVLGFLIVNEIQRLIREIPLFDTGAYHRSIHSYVKEGILYIESAVSYSVYLEFGTMELTVKELEVPKMPKKKKDVSPSVRKTMKKGVGAFAPFRRILFNKKLMESLVNKAFKI